MDHIAHNCSILLTNDMSQAEIRLTSHKEKKHSFEKAYYIAHQKIISVAIQGVECIDLQD